MRCRTARCYVFALPTPGPPLPAWQSLLIPLANGLPSMPINLIKLALHAVIAIRAIAVTPAAAASGDTVMQLFIVSSPQNQATAAILIAEMPTSQLHCGDFCREPQPRGWIRHHLTFQMAI